jgi:hypothetical protein
MVCARDKSCRQPGSKKVERNHAIPPRTDYDRLYKGFDSMMMSAGRANAHKRVEDVLAGEHCNQNASEAGAHEHNHRNQRCKHNPYHKTN